MRVFVKGDASLEWYFMIKNTCIILVNIKTAKTIALINCFIVCKILHDVSVKWSPCCSLTGYSSDNGHVNNRLLKETTLFLYVAHLDTPF